MASRRIIDLQLILGYLKWLDSSISNSSPGAERRSKQWVAAAGANRLVLLFLVGLLGSLLGVLPLDAARPRRK
jgi:hypothetical protein